MTTKYFYIMGSASGVGKTTLCEALLSELLKNGYGHEQLAYIKPMTQCLEKQSVTVFCEQQKITHQSIGSLVFSKGFTKDFIEGLTKTSSALLEDIVTELTQISEDKEIVVVDGIGSPTTGSVVGVSNVDIARSLSAPVLFIGKAGIGSAIDDTILAVNFMQQGGVKNIALAYNKIEPSEIVDVKYLVSKRLVELLPDIPVLDFIPNQLQLNRATKQYSATKIYHWFTSQMVD